jgi:hypothetical protein
MKYINCLSLILHLSDDGEKCEYNGAAHQLFIDSEKACDSVRSEVLYNVLTKFGELIQMFQRNRVGKICLMHFLFRIA